MTIEELERQLEAQERRRRLVEAGILSTDELATLDAPPIPGSEDIDEILRDAEKRLADVREVVALVERLRAGAKAIAEKQAEYAERQVLQVDIAALVESVDRLQSLYQPGLEQVSQTLSQIVARLDAEAAENAKLRARQREVMDKIDKYVDRWT